MQPGVFCPCFVHAAPYFNDVKGLIGVWTGAADVPKFGSKLTNIGSGRPIYHR
jgi:hypothetical protein